MRATIPTVLRTVLLAAAALCAHVVAAQSAGTVADFTELYERSAPAVVTIQVVQAPKPSASRGLPEGHPPLEPFHRRGPGSGDAPRERRSEGSGFVVDSDGYVVTNAHVVEDASEVLVRLADNREFRAKVIGADKAIDVALLRIDATGLPRLPVGSPEALRVGDWVVAIGRPLGLANSMTAGIVSGKARDLPDEDLVPFIQTDAAVNPGSSGGPLINLRGEAVGITSMIYSRTGGYMGISFAIPIDVAMASVAQLKAKGRVTRGRIGVEIAQVDRDTAESFGLPVPSGALVSSVERDGPAERAGLQPGDIVLAVDGRGIASVAELPRIVTAMAPGTTATLTVWRANAKREVPVVVAEQKDDAKPAASAVSEAKPGRLGLALADLSDAEKRDLGLSAGVRVVGLAEGLRANVRAGDVLLAVVLRGETVEATSAQRVATLVATLPKGTPVTLRLRRGDQAFFASVRVSGDP